MTGDGLYPVRVNRVVINLVALVLVPAFALVHRMRRTGAEHIPRSGPVLFVSNHISVWDPPMVGTALRPRHLHYMAKRELFRNRLISWAMRNVGAFPVERGGADRAAIRTSRAILAGGHALLMFPEGTRSVDGLPGRAWPGAGSLALEPDVVVVPVAIWGSQRRFGPVRVCIGAPLDFSDLPAGSRGTRAQAAADRMMDAIAGLLARAGGPVREGVA
jgi:1-acyl-sn-glycerol-3-phosphate acyltransferase